MYPLMKTKPAYINLFKDTRLKFLHNNDFSFKTQYRYHENVHIIYAIYILHSSRAKKMKSQNRKHSTTYRYPSKLKRFHAYIVPSMASYSFRNSCINVSIYQDDNYSLKNVVFYCIFFAVYCKLLIYYFKAARRFKVIEHFRSEQKTLKYIENVAIY